ncbi:hypothetical protein [Mycolicibacterium llatzerense]|uniref:hypothetical protein n=1 Tax=Mycolicibacterium llatzerense TaxID=280871 RepID=UPI0008DE0A94|nr:hypothetical protein [Mycolicibacterium llatzerense]
MSTTTNHETRRLRDGRLVVRIAHRVATWGSPCAVDTSDRAHSGDADTHDDYVTLRDRLLVESDE